MNILFFLTPKKDVGYVYSTDTVGEASGKMLKYQFTTVPVLDVRTGRYEGTLAADDLLREVQRHPTQTISAIDDRSLLSLMRRRDYQPVRADADIEDLLSYAATQNFVPVVDDTGAFIGIVTRREVMKYLLRKCMCRPEKTEKTSAEGTQDRAASLG